MSRSSLSFYPAGSRSVYKPHTPYPIPDHLSALKSIPALSFPVRMPVHRQHPLRKSSAVYQNFSVPV